MDSRRCSLLDTFISFSFGDYEHAVHNTEQISWEEFTKRCPMTVSNLGVSYFFMDSLEKLHDFMQKMSFIAENVCIEPGHQMEFIVKNRPGFAGEQSLPTGDIPTVKRVQKPVMRPSIELPTIQDQLQAEVSKITPEESWSCPNCGCDWPKSAVQPGWVENGRCDAC
jgi:hypothetical protein